MIGTFLWGMWEGTDRMNRIGAGLLRGERGRTTTGYDGELAGADLGHARVDTIGYQRPPRHGPYSYSPSLPSGWTPWGRHMTSPDWRGV